MFKRFFLKKKCKLPRCLRCNLRNTISLTTWPQCSFSLSFRKSFPFHLGISTGGTFRIWSTSPAPVCSLLHLPAACTAAVLLSGMALPWGATVSNWSGHGIAWNQGLTPLFSVAVMGWQKKPADIRLFTSVLSASLGTSVPKISPLFKHKRVYITGSCL